MDIVFDCPNCGQELAVDSSGAGTDIECPSCGGTITIPQASTKVPAVPEATEPVASGTASSAMASSAAAKVTMHLKVPVRSAPGESLITKPKPPLAAIARGADKKIRVHTIRHSACIESGHDKFDEKVTEFLNQIGEANIIGIHTISYTYFDVGTQKILTDYGMLVVYRG